MDSQAAAASGRFGCPAGDGACCWASLHPAPAWPPAHPSRFRPSPAPLAPSPQEHIKEQIAAIGENIQVRRFSRYVLGEGIEKKQVDFAAEVAAQTGGKL